MEKRKKLDALRLEIEKCETCRRAGWGKQVFGEGDPDAKIMFVGEAPGRQEATAGRPFIGRSGQLLRKMIREVGLKEEDVYITSPVKFFPNGGTPTRKEVLHSKIHFDKQVKIIDPELMVLLGKTAASAVLDHDVAIMKDHGKVLNENGRKILLTIHPAAVLRFPKYKTIFKEDFEKIKPG
jgi:DNA polymerase